MSAQFALLIGCKIQFPEFEARRDFHSPKRPKEKKYMVYVLYIYIYGYPCIMMTWLICLAARVSFAVRQGLQMAGRDSRLAQAELFCHS